MVRAILEGRKTQTRRPVKFPNGADPFASWYDNSFGESYFHVAFGSGVDRHFERMELNCPFGQPGDLLWVRETWQTTRALDHCKPSGIAPGAPIQYIADRWNKGFGLPDAGKQRPSIFMMQWMSRITLRVKSIRIERVQDITDDDAKAEGFENRDAFFMGWIDCGYDIPSTNPWVWVIEFERVEGEVRS